MVLFQRWDTHGPPGPTPWRAFSYRGVQTWREGRRGAEPRSCVSGSSGSLALPGPSQSLPAPLCDPRQPWLGEAVLMGTVAKGHQRADTAVRGEEGLSGAGPALPWTLPGGVSLTLKGQPQGAQQAPP